MVQMHIMHAHTHTHTDIETLRLAFSGLLPVALSSKQKRMQWSHMMLEANNSLYTVVCVYKNTVLYSKDALEFTFIHLFPLGAFL